MRSKKRPCQPKTAKRIFGGPGSQGPSGQAKERTRILPVRRGFSAPGVPRRLPGRPLFRSLPLLWRLLCPVPRRFLPVCHCLVPGLRAACLICVWPALPPVAFVFVLRCQGCLPKMRCVLSCTHFFFLLSFALSCLTFASQTSFHLSLRPRRASTFFRKESRQRFAKGLRPFEPHSCALRPIFSFSALLAGLRGLSGRKPPADGETLEKPRSRAQLFKRFCAKRDACALSLINPFPRAAGRLNGPSGRKPPADKGNARKAKEQSSSFSGVSVRWGCAGAFARRVSSLPQGTGGGLSPCPGK